MIRSSDHEPSTVARTFVSRWCAPIGLAFRLAACGGLLALYGCPEMLEDNFDFVNDAGNGGETFDPGVGGTGGMAGSGGGAGGGGTQAGGGGGTEDIVPADRASVLSTSPADGALGVLPDAVLVFTFSAPMDTASVEAAYSSVDLPAGSVTFAWSAGDTVLEILPDTALQAAAGTDPSVVVPTQYTLGFSAQAQDKEGHALLASELSFSVARSITQALKAVQDRDLTGNWRTDGSYGVASCERADTTICVGDGALTAEPDPAYRALMTFDLGSLPSNAISVTGAELSLVVSDMFGTPFSSLGTLRVEHVEFTSIGDSAFAAAPLSTSQLMSSSAALGDRMSVQVLADVEADWDVRNHSQYRLAFDTGSDEDDAPDHVISNWTTAQLDVTYWLP